MDKIIDIKNLNFAYKNKTIFSNFDLSIEKGNFVSIIGPNGSGKTTLIKILLGLVNYQGYVNIDGYVVNNFFLKEVRRKIGLVWTNSAFISETVMDDLVFSLENLQYNKDEIKSMVNNISKLFKIDSLLEKDPNTLNNSDKQKVLIAGAMIFNPKIIILDNALHQLTPRDKKDVIKILKKYQQDYKTTIIMIANDIEDSLYSDRIIVLNNGSIYLQGSVNDVFKEEKKLAKLKIKRPFIIELSTNLILYDLIQDIYLDMKELVDELWK